MDLTEKNFAAVFFVEICYDGAGTDVSTVVII